MMLMKFGWGGMAPLAPINPPMLCAQNPLIPEEMRELIVGHIVTVHESVGVFSRDFQHKLRRSNYVTPKNYLDFINTYLLLLDNKDKFILNQV